MNESILRALMRLFAIVSDINKEGQSSNKRGIVMDYLDRQYSDEIVQKYIDFFDQQVNYLHMISKDPVIDDAAVLKINAENRIIELCRQINEELEHEQKIIVLIYLLDFIHSGVKHTRTELSLVRTAAAYLKIGEDEFLDAKSFTFESIEKIAHQDWLLFIRPRDVPSPFVKQITVDKLEGQIVVLRIPSADTYVFRYYGNMKLLINGHRINPGRSYIWPVGAVIRNPKIGSVYFSWVRGRFIRASAESKFVFTAEEIAFNYFNSKNGVKRFNLTEESGRLVGIIGGSGSGKSTLLNVLNGNLKTRRGSIKINGWDIHENKEMVKGIIGYVPQDDLLIKELTVYENLYYNTRLCFDGYSEDLIRDVVEDALVDFDLVEASDLHVGDAFNTILSGGQRKRLNIALELIREPSILFVDEPTSGLSSADSEKVITLLKRQTLKGKLVIANMHQPSSDVFKMIDKLLVMDQGGRVIYYGHPISAITYFKKEAHYADAEETECLSCGNINTDEILRIVESREVDANGRLTRKRKTSPEEWYQRFLVNIDVQTKKIEREHDSSIPRNNFKIPDHFNQFRIFLKRDLLAKYYNKQYLMLLALEAPMLAFVLAFFSKNYTWVNGLPLYIFGENAVLPAFLFMAVIVALFLGLVISAEEIFKDRKILKREKFLNLSRSSYLFSKICILFSISALQSLIFVLIGNSMLEIEGMLLRYWIVLFTASCWANMIGLNISSGFNSVVTIYILIPLILVPQLLFSGVVVDFTKMHNKIANDKTVPLIGDLMTSRWAYEALAVSQFKDNSFERHFFEAESRARNASYFRSYAIPALLKIAGDTRDLHGNKTDTLRYTNNLTVIRTEVEKIAGDIGWERPRFVDSLSVRLYNPALNASLSDFLDRAVIVFRKRYNMAVDDRDRIYYQQVAALGGQDEFLRFRQEYYNKQLALVVTNEKEIQNYSVHDGEMIPLKDAVFRLPSGYSWRSHFYAPVKYMFGQRVDTFWFNLLVIWFFSILLLALLYYDVIRKALTYMESLRLNRLNKLRLNRLIRITEQSRPVRKR
ncbi:MAG TPA: ATP-binding cassette domain-containing protein [Bacteroidales bacterium]|nr:ATP-binding cassette domain-containing protein [Bacteroidales bacterium]